MNRTRLAAAIASTLLVTAGTTALTTAPPAEASAASSAPSHTREGASYAETTGVGMHNAYDKDTYPYFADALDSGASLLELDVWTNSFSGDGFRVAHDNPVGNDSNCENASSPDDLKHKDTDQDFAGCLADMRAWHDAHPDHGPVMIKVEMKDGFYDKGDRGPDEFDALLKKHLGDALFGPSDVVGDHADLDEAVGAGGWPSRDQLQGKFLFDLIPGTVEEGNPADHLWTDEEYGTHLKDLADDGKLDEAGAFPAVHKAEAGDPRTKRYDQAIRPWFVVFDGDASAYADGSIDTGWYQQHGYLVTMTDAHKVPPEIDGSDPTEQQARDKVAQVAADHASFATADWAKLPSVLSSVVPRG